MPNYESIEQQKIVFRFVPNNTNLIPHENTKYIKGDNYSLNIELNFVKPQPKYFENDELFIAIFGTPIIETKINTDLLIHKIRYCHDYKSLMPHINGEFLIVIFNKKQSHLHIINDRFASIPIYYFQNNSIFIASFLYADLVEELKKQNSFTLNEYNLFIFCGFRRLFDDLTHDNVSKYLKPATILNYSNKRINLSKYWMPSYKKTKNKIKDNAVQLIELMKNSIDMKTSDHKNYGLFLSGGHDTRFILSLFPHYLVAYTLAADKNFSREYDVAKQLCQIKGNVKHVHLPFNDGHFWRIFDAALHQSGLMYQVNSIFLGYKNEVAEQDVDVLFHGHGIDYMFQGMYLPSKNYRLFGKTLRYRSLKTLSPDLLLDTFIHSVGFRIPLHILKPYIHHQWLDKLQDYQHSILNKLIKESQQSTDDVYDQWDYLCFHALSRHYSYPDHESIHTNAEQRTLTFENQLYDFYLSLPVNHRFDKRILRKALALTSPEMYQVYSANNNLPIGSRYKLTYLQFKNFLAKKLRLKKNHTQKESNIDHLCRTWPTHHWLLINDANFRREILNLNFDSPVAQLHWLDIEKLINDIHKWVNTNHTYYQDQFGRLVWQILSINRFLKKIYE